MLLKISVRKPYPQVQEGSSTSLLHKKEQFSLYLMRLSQNLTLLTTFPLKGSLPFIFFSNLFRKSKKLNTFQNMSTLFSSYKHNYEFVLWDTFYCTQVCYFVCLYVCVTKLCLLVKLQFLIWSLFCFLWFYTCICKKLTVHTASLLLFVKYGLPTTV